MGTWKTATLQAKSLLSSKTFIASLWVIFALGATAKQYLNNSYNNYLIFKYTFWHAHGGQNLYQTASEYQDINHYGPLFSVLFTPFAILPDFLGMLLWQVFNALFLLFAINKLPLDQEKRGIIALITVHELLTSQFSFQVNASIAAIIVLTFIQIESRNEFWASVLIAVGTLTKLYGIVGIAFIVFSKKKIRFVGFLVMSLMIFTCLPMIFFGVTYINQSYIDWWHVLVEKNLENTLSTYQDISVMGMIRRLTHYPQLSNWPIIVPGLIILGLPFLRKKEFYSLDFRLLTLASILLFTVLFSSGSESPTYIIAFLGVAIWWVTERRPLTMFDWGMLIFALVLTSFSPSDLFPAWLRKNYVQPYALKALPCFIIWCYISYHLIFTRFNNTLVTKKASSNP